MTSILDALRERDSLAQVSDSDACEVHLNSGSRTVYSGFDPTAPSLHIGNMVPLLALRRFQLAGHKPIALAGGATGLIGDPSGRGTERVLNDQELVNAWVEKLQAQMERFLDFSGSYAATVVNNLDWTQGLSALDFLRDVGKHFSVNAMIQRDSVKSRLDRDGEGISFTEFSYMLLQSLDFLELHKRFGCTVQLGGSDQWGNMVSGVDLIRRVAQQSAFVVTFPLLTKSDGSKFGKTAGEAIWLDPEMTSPYSFYQYWLNTPDTEMAMYLSVFSLCSQDERLQLLSDSEVNPERRIAQRRLAQDLTTMVHGSDMLVAAERITAAFFDGDISWLTEADMKQLLMAGVDSVDVHEGSAVIEAVVDLGLALSRGKARQLIASGGLSANNAKVDSEEATFSRSSALHGKYHLLRRGRKTWALAVHLED